MKRKMDRNKKEWFIMINRHQDNNPLSITCKIRDLRDSKKSW